MNSRASGSVALSSSVSATDAWKACVREPAGGAGAAEPRLERADAVGRHALLGPAAKQRVADLAGGAVGALRKRPPQMIPAEMPEPRFR